MMGRQNNDQGPLFCEFRLDEAVPDDHLVRQIDAVLDLSWVYAELAPHYPTLGRPSIDPVLMIRMLIIGYVFGLRSERLLCREVQVNFAYRWFCRLGIEHKIPDHSAFSRARNERFRESGIFRSVFERVVEACIAAGLVGGEGFAVDASLIAADANKQRSIPGSEWQKPRDPETASRAVKGYLATLDDVAFGAASNTTPKFVSPSDPAAQWTGAMRGPAFFAYADNYLIDVKFGVIMDVKASRAIRQAEVGAAKTMVERTEERFDIKPKWLAADTAYGSGANLNWLVEDKGIAPHIPVIDKSKRDDGTFSRDDFTFDGSAMSIPARRARPSRRRAGWSTMARLSSIAQAPMTVALVRSNQNAGRKPQSAESHAASMREPVTLPGRWPRLKRSSNHAAIANASRCCLPISSAFSSWVVFGCGARTGRRTSSRSRPSPRTCAGSPSWSSDRHLPSPSVLRNRCGDRGQCVKAATPNGAVSNR
jgi:transposase